LISQPIKGTAKRFVDPVKDELAKKLLVEDPKSAQKIL
jgi:anthranilate/para-aminobenzoate synthase component I